MKGRFISKVLLSYVLVACLAAAAALFFSQARGVMRVTAWAAVAATLVAIAFGAGYWRRIFLVLDRLTQFTQALEAGRFPKRLRLTTSGETAQLASALDRLADRLETSLRNVSWDRATLEAVLESQPDPVIAVDRSLKIVFANGPAKEAFSRGSRAEVAVRIIGKDAMEALRDHDLVSLLNDAISDRHPVAGTLQIGIDPPRMYHVTATPVENEGPDVEGVVCVLHDQTALRRLEQIRSDFVANVSHELRTPLTAIHGFIETLQNGSYRDSERVLRYLHIMHDETTRLIALITDLLHLSRLEAPESVLKLEPVNVSDLATDVVELFRRQAEAKSLSLSIEVQPDLPEVRVDGALIRQALLNLVDNAVKYTESGSVSVCVDRDDIGVRITVADTGVGIPSDALERVFERFYRVDKARSRNEGGTGLGLSIVKHTVESHKGRLDIASTPGKGTTVWLSLPAPQRDVPETADDFH